MARPVDADSAATYDGIVSSALAMLDEVGRPEKLSMRNVASGAGCSLGTIQYYFGSKQQLLEACLDGYYGRLSALAGELTQSAQTLTGRALVEHAARSFHRFASRERALIRLRISTRAGLGELHPARQPEFMGAIIAHAAQVLEPHVEVPLLDVRFAAQAVASIIVRLVLLDDEELEAMTGAKGAAARARLEDFVVSAARRLVRPSDG